MIYPLDEPHLAALRVVCQRRIAEPRIGAIVLPDDFDQSMRFAEAFLVIDTPALTAQLVRDLLGACGCPVDIEVVRGVQWRIVYYLGTQRVWRAVNWANGEIIPDIPALVLALLDALAKNEGRDEAALRALREAAR